MKYSLNIPNISSKEQKYVNDVVKSGWLSSNGKHDIVAKKKFCQLVKKIFIICTKWYRSAARSFKSY